jgi:N-acetylmuramate 1-kinase
MRHVTTPKLSALRKKWVEVTLKSKVQYQSLKGDASTRQYYRVKHGDGTYILMLLTTESELKKCIETSKLLQSRHLPCPITYAYTKKHLMILQEDFGDQRLLEKLSIKNVNHWYNRAILIQKKLQTISSQLSIMGKEVLTEECDLAWSWYFRKEHNLDLIESDFTAPRDWLVETITQLPYTPIHRDFHAGNIMIHDNALKLIDYQDLCFGPIGYDLVSLIKDCYIEWPQALRYQWIKTSYTLTDPGISLTRYVTAIELLGIQRHMKCLGIFARLKHRYQKPTYMEHIPRLINYITEASEPFDELKPWTYLLKETLACTR